MPTTVLSAEDSAKNTQDLRPLESAWIIRSWQHGIRNGPEVPRKCPHNAKVFGKAKSFTSAEG